MYTLRKDKWFEDYGFVVSYGVDGKISPIGDTLGFKEFQLYNGSTDIKTFLNLSREDREKAFEAVFSNRHDDLRLRIPVCGLNKLRNILEKYGAQESIDEEMIPLLSSLSLDDMDATLESIDINGNSTILGTNYRIYPYRGRERERFIGTPYEEDLNLER